MRIIIQAKLLILFTFLVGCTHNYDYVTIKKNPIYYDPLIKGSISEVMTCVSESIDQNAYVDDIIGGRIRFSQEIRAIPNSAKGSIGLSTGVFLIGLIDFLDKGKSTRVQFYAHETESCSLIPAIYSKCNRVKFINAIKACEK
jgi:hypothetical protein